MATVKDKSRPPANKARIALYIGAGFLLILIAILAYNFSFIKGQLTVGTAYGARVACSCHYIGGRDLADCEKDFEPGMEVIGLSHNKEKRRVTASALLMVSATAEFREGWGCVLLDEQEAKEE